jgi:hypothetical protein
MTDAVKAVSSNVYKTPDINSQQVDDAVKALSQTAVDHLWEEKVTNVVWYNKVVGVLSYAWNRSKAVAKDKEAGNAGSFNEASVALSQAVAKRCFSPDEVDYLIQMRVLNSPKGNSPELQYGPETRDAYANQILAANSKLDAFYAAFKERCEQLGIDDERFITYSVAAQKIINNFGVAQSKLNKRDRVRYPENFRFQLITTQKQFQDRIVHDEVAIYANQPINKITLKSFQREIAIIQGFSPQTETVVIENLLSQAIKEHHHPDEIKKIRNEYKNPSSDRAKNVRSKIEKKYNDKITRLETNFKTFVGKDRKFDKGFDFENVDRASKLGKAFKALEKADATVKKAALHYEDLNKQLTRLVRNNAPAKELLKDGVDATTLATAKQDLVKKTKNCKKELARFNKLQAKAQNLNQKLCVLASHFENFVKIDTQAKLDEIVNFYNTFLVDVKNSNKVVKIPYNETENNNGCSDAIEKKKLKVE